MRVSVYVGRVGTESPAYVRIYFGSGVLGLMSVLVWSDWGVGGSVCWGSEVRRGVFLLGLGGRVSKIVENTYNADMEFLFCYGCMLMKVMWCGRFFWSCMVLSVLSVMVIVTCIHVMSRTEQSWESFGYDGNAELVFVAWMGTV